MPFSMPRTAVIALAGAALTLIAGAASADDHRQVSYKITIENLTAGQPFTPPVIAVHNRRANVFRLGRSANEGVRMIAENGNNVPLVTALSGNTNVDQVVEGTAPIVPAGNPGNVPFESTASYTITTDGSATHLSWVSMLICTNDGFTGVNTVSLPRYRKTILARGYDARSEQNTEDFADIVPPCQGLTGFPSDDAGTGESNPLLSERGVIIPHAGVAGDNDLDSRVHNWADPVARIVIERIRRKD